MTTTTKKSFVVKIDREHCKGCELCVINCPQKILVLSNNVNKLGYIMCPDYLIEIYEK